MRLKIIFILLLIVVGTLSGFGQQPVNQRLLVGEWSRNETRCLIKISEAYENGKLELTYFDLKSINTGKTFWLIKGTFLSLYVELLDENNQGSYYKLNYNLERDMLIGEYFQADPEVSHPVEFVRTKQ